MFLLYFRLFSKGLWLLFSSSVVMMQRFITKIHKLLVVNTLCSIFYPTVYGVVRNSENLITYIVNTLSKNPNKTYIGM